MPLLVGFKAMKERPHAAPQRIAGIVLNVLSESELTNIRVKWKSWKPVLIAEMQ